MYMWRNTTSTNDTEIYAGGITDNMTFQVANVDLLASGFSNLSIVYNASVDNMSVYINGNKLANITGLGNDVVVLYTNVSNAWLNENAWATNIVGFSNEFDFNVTNVTVNYTWTSAYTSYTIDPNNAIITPAHSGRFYTDYNYGYVTSNLIQMILLVLPILAAVIILVYIGKELTDLV
jgi:hypothetical protein